MEDDEKKNKFCNTASEMAKGISKAKRLSYLFLNYLADRAHYINVTDETIMRYIVKTLASRNPRADSEKITESLKSWLHDFQQLRLFPSLSSFPSDEQAIAFAAGDMIESITAHFALFFRFQRRCVTKQMERVFHDDPFLLRPYPEGLHRSIITKALNNSIKTINEVAPGEETPLSVVQLERLMEEGEEDMWVDIHDDNDDSDNINDNNDNGNDDDDNGNDRKKTTCCVCS